MLLIHGSSAFERKRGIIRTECKGILVKKKKIDQCTGSIAEGMFRVLKNRCEHGWTYWSGILCLFGAHKGDKRLPIKKA